MAVTEFRDRASNDGKEFAGADTTGGKVASLAPVGFRLVAEFSLSAEAPDRLLRAADLTDEQRRLFRAALEVPAWNRMCRLAIVSEFEADPPMWSRGLFRGPNPEHILESILPELTLADQQYWIDLRDNDLEALGFYVEPVFQAIRSSLVSVKIVEVASGEAIPVMISGMHA
jgi:hypothetical protein